MNEIAGRLERLERSMDILIRAGGGIGREEYKRRVLREVQKVVSEYGRHDVAHRVECMNDILHCSKRRFCTKSIVSKVESAGMAYLQDDHERTLDILRDLERSIENCSDDCEVDECRAYALGLVSEVITVFEVAGRIERGIGSLPHEMEDVAPLDPQEVSRMLTPLSHPTRVSILMKLEQGGMGFTELSRELDLRTGHLQFHLRALENVGYIRQERRGGHYVISLQGMTALSGLRELMTDLVTKSGDACDVAQSAEAMGGN